MSVKIHSAMVLAAGLGTRMRASPGDPPKPLVEVGGHTLLGRMLDRLDAYGIRRVVVNVHHCAEAIEDFVRGWSLQKPHIETLISDERVQRLETGGGVKKALGLLGDDPFFVCNADILWHENLSNLTGLAERFSHKHMDACLLLATRDQAMGYDGRGDFNMSDDGLLSRPNHGQAQFVFSGVQITTPAGVRSLPDGTVSLNVLFDMAISKGRLFGLPLVGQWMHVGTPEGREAADHYLKALR